MSEQPPEGVEPATAPTPPSPAYPTYPAPPQYGQPQYGQPQYGQPQYGQPQYGYPPYGYPGPASGKRPGTVTTAIVMTWVLTGLTLLFSLLLFGLALSDNSDFFNAFTDNGDFSDITRDELRNIVTIVSVVFILWCAAALVFSVFAFRGQSWGRTALVVSAGLSAVLDLVGILAVFPLFFAIATIVVIVLLYNGGANEWYRSRKSAGSPQAPSGVTFYQ
jgi:hypothetical protein